MHVHVHVHLFMVIHLYIEKTEMYINEQMMLNLGFMAQILRKMCLKIVSVRFRKIKVGKSYKKNLEISLKFTVFLDSIRIFRVFFKKIFEIFALICTF